MNQPSVQISIGGKVRKFVEEVNKLFQSLISKSGIDDSAKNASVDCTSVLLIENTSRDKIVYKMRLTIFIRHEFREDVGTINQFHGD